MNMQIHCICNLCNWEEKIGYTSKSFLYNHVIIHPTEQHCQRFCNCLRTSTRKEDFGSNSLVSLEVDDHHMSLQYLGRHKEGRKNWED